jgi:CPA2 family monovalent cation:H+ antiporter-2
MHNSVHLSEVVLLLCAAVCIVPLFRVLRLSPVLGYLVAGTVIGPYGFRLIGDVATTTGIAEFGVIFLLFLIGLELSFERLRSMRKHVFGFGGAQVFITAGIFAALFVGFGGHNNAAIIIGGGLALSSTAIVLQVVAEQGEKSSQVGRLALAVLILQDLVVIPLLVLVPLLAQSDSSLADALGLAALKAIAYLVLVFGAGRLLLRPLFHFIASLDSMELFSATTLFVVLGMAWLATTAGLSPALGAFMAGLLVAETAFKHQVESDILPYKGLFLGLFFMTVGMSLDLGMLLERFAGIVGITVALMATKALVIMALCRVFGFALAAAVHVGLLLSQGSEFAFILFALAADQGLMDPAMSQVLLVVITMSMALTPLIAGAGQRIAFALEKLAGARSENLLDETLDLSHHVIVSGYGRVGHTVARLLEVEDMPYVAIDMDSYLVSKERKSGVPVYYGDTTRIHVLTALGVARARALIITHNDTRVALQTITTIRAMGLDMPIIARAKNLEQVQRLEKAGATLAVAEMFETSLQLSAALLKSVGVNDYEITRILEIFRAEDYALTRTAEREVTA